MAIIKDICCKLRLHKSLVDLLVWSMPLKQKKIMSLHGFLFQSMRAYINIYIYISVSTFRHAFCCSCYNVVLFLEWRCYVCWPLGLPNYTIKLLKLNCYSLDQQTDGKAFKNEAIHNVKIWLNRSYLERKGFLNH